MSLGEVFMWVWDKVLSPVFDFLGTAVIWLWTHIISPYLGFIGTLWSVIFAGMKLAWDYVLKPVFTAIGAVVEWLAAGFKLQFDLIVNAFRLVGAIAN